MDENIQSQPEADGGNKWPSISDVEFNNFHHTDRMLFARLVLNLQRDPKESMNFMAFWLWLEQEFRDSTLIYKMLTSPAMVLNDLAEETTLCFRCVENELFPFSYQELFFVRNFMRGRVTFRALVDNREAAIEGVSKMMNQVCSRAFKDILQRFFTTSSAVVGPPRLPPPPPQSDTRRSVLPHTAPPFIPASVRAGGEGYSHMTDIIRCGSGPPSSEDGILGSGALNAPGVPPNEVYNPYGPNIQFGGNVQIRTNRPNLGSNAVVGPQQAFLPMMFPGGDVVRHHQQAAALFPRAEAAVGMPGWNPFVGHPLIASPNFQQHHVVHWLPVVQTPAIPPQMFGYDGVGPSEQSFLDDELLRFYLETMNMLNDEPELDFYSADARTIFLTFSKGYPISEEEVYEFFTRKFGDIIESIHMQDVQENEQVLFAKIVVRSAAHVNAVVLGGRAKYVINGKHVMVRKFVKKQPGEARNPPPPPAAAHDIAGPSNA